MTFLLTFGADEAACAHRHFSYRRILRKLKIEGLATQEETSLKGIISPTTIGILAAAQEVKAMGKTVKVLVSGLGTPNTMRPYVEGGQVPAHPPICDISILCWRALAVARCSE